MGTNTVNSSHARNPAKHRLFVGLEGGIGAGKTTIATRLTSRGFVHIPEFMSFVADPKAYIDPDWSQSARVQFFLEMEKRRSGMAATANHLVLDRTFLTILAHDFAITRLGQSPDLAPYFAIDPNEILWPQTLFFLSVSSPVRLQRIRERNDRLSYLADDRFNEEVFSYFQQIGSYLPVHVIDTHQLSVADVAQQIAGLATKPHEIPPLTEGALYRSALKILANA